MRLPRTQLAAIALALALVGAGLLFEELRDSAPMADAAPGPKRTSPAGHGDHDWPPALNETYPPLVLLGLDDQWHAIADLKGRPVLIQVVGMSCPASNAFAGAGEDGLAGFHGVVPQADLPSLRSDLKRFAGGLALDDQRFTVVHLLLYDMELHAPSVADARAWAAHFGVDKLANHLVLVGDDRLVCPASFAMVPGYQLLDRDLVLRRDATGHQPKHSLYTDLLPELARMLGDRGGPVAAEPPDSGISPSVEDAYKKIRHPHAPLDLSALPADEREGLQRLLRGVDEAVRLRVALWWSCSAGDAAASAKLLAQLDELGKWFEHVDVPAVLDSYRRDIARGLAAQRAFYDDWRRKGDRFDSTNFARHPQAQAGSRAIHEAYDELMRRYAGASEADRRAFFDRHCALDII